MVASEQLEIERIITNGLRDVSRTNGIRLKAGLRVLMGSSIEAYEKVISAGIKKELEDFKKILDNPEMLAPISCKTETGKEEVIQTIKNTTLNNLHLLDDRTSILPNTSLVQKSIMEGERLKTVIHASAMKNVIANSQYMDELEKRFLFEGKSAEQSKLMAERAIQSTRDLHKAVLEGNISNILRSLAVRGVDINLPDEQGMTPLHLACRDGLTETVKLLLTVPNIKVNAISNNGWTPLHIAAREGFADIVDALLTIPSLNPNAVNSDGWTALHWAAWHGHIEVVTVLLTSIGLEVNQADKLGTTALHWAARNGHPDVITILVSVPKVLVNPIDNEKRTPLNLAAMYNHEGAVTALLRAKDIHPNLADMDGFTPLHWAARNGQEGILKALLKHPDTLPEELDNNYMTPLDWARRNGHVDIIRILSPKPSPPRHPPSFWQAVRLAIARLFKKKEPETLD